MYAVRLKCERMRVSFVVAKLLISLKYFCHQSPPEVQYNSFVQPQIQVNDASRVAMARCGPIFQYNLFNWKIFSQISQLVA